MFREKFDRWYFLILALIFAVAVLLRVVGAGWGMPLGNLHPDEGLIFGQAYQFALNRDFDVHDYYRPNHVTIKLNTLIYVGIQELYFAPQGRNDFAANYNESFALFTTASRVLTALFGVGTVICAYLIGLFWGRKQALYTTLLFAVFLGVYASAVVKGAALLLAQILPLPVWSLIWPARTLPKA